MTVSLEFGGTTTVVFSGSRGALLLMQPGSHASDASINTTGSAFIVVLLRYITGKFCNPSRKS
jgi:hypothetical protein